MELNGSLVFSFTLPPLRYREGNIEILANYFLSQYSKEYRRNINEFSPEAVDLLRFYPWPGNVRELKNVIERIEPKHLKLGEGHLVKDYPLSTDNEGAIKIEIPPNGLLLSEMEKAIIKEALKKQD